MSRRPRAVTRSFIGAVIGTLLLLLPGCIPTGEHLDEPLIDKLVSADAVVVRSLQGLDVVDSQSLAELAAGEDGWLVVLDGPNDPRADEVRDEADVIIYDVVPSETVRVSSRLMMYDGPGQSFGDRSSQAYLCLTYEIAEGTLIHRSAATCPEELVPKGREYLLAPFEAFDGKWQHVT